MQRNSATPVVYYAKLILAASVTLLTLMSTCLLAWVCWQRMILPYTENGSYFHEESVTVYYSQALYFYIPVTIFLFFVSLLQLRKWYCYLRKKNLSRT